MSEPSKGNLPGKFKEFVARYPELGAAHQQIAAAAEAAGPMDRKTIELVKIGLSIGAGLESATRSHVRQALQHGATEAEVEQVALLAYNTCGWPRMVAGYAWVRQQIERGP